MVALLWSKEQILTSFNARYYNNPGKHLSMFNSKLNGTFPDTLELITLHCSLIHLSQPDFLMWTLPSLLQWVPCTRQVDFLVKIIQDDSFLATLYSTHLAHGVNSTPKLLQMLEMQTISSASPSLFTLLWLPAYFGLFQALAPVPLKY